jgi:hypothetical protein
MFPHNRLQRVITQKIQFQYEFRYNAITDGLVSLETCHNFSARHTRRNPRFDDDLQGAGIAQSV